MSSAVLPAVRLKERTGSTATKLGIARNPLYQELKQYVLSRRYLDARSESQVHAGPSRISLADRTYGDSFWASQIEVTVRNPHTTFHTARRIDLLRHVTNHCRRGWLGAGKQEAVVFWLWPLPCFCCKRQFFGWPSISLGDCPSWRRVGRIANRRSLQPIPVFALDETQRN